MVFHVADVVWCRGAGLLTHVDPQADVIVISRSGLEVVLLLRNAPAACACGREPKASPPGTLAL